MNDEDGRHRDLEPVGNLVDRVVADVARRAGLGPGAAVMSKWPALSAGEWDKATPLRIEAGTLHVRVPDGISATRLRHATGPLLARIERLVGPDVVSSVRVHVRPTGRR